jgi:hypothetical protein
VGVNEPDDVLAKHHQPSRRAALTARMRNLVMTMQCMVCPGSLWRVFGGQSRCILQCLISNPSYSNRTWYHMLKRCKKPPKYVRPKYASRDVVCERGICVRHPYCLRSALVRSDVAIVCLSYKFRRRSPTVPSRSWRQWW